jgi:hypothetical protein
MSELLSRADVTPHKDSAEISSLLNDIKILTSAEDEVIRNGEKKTLGRSLLFFASKNVATASYYDKVTDSHIRLYDWDLGYKDCEIQETQEALEMFSEKFNNDPNSVTETDALEALSELSDVCYNLAQLVDESEFQAIVRSFSAREDLFHHLLNIAKAKYTFRYLEYEPEEILTVASVVYDNGILENLRSERKKDTELEINEVLLPIYGEKDGFLTDLLVNNWDHISMILRATESTARTLAEEIDQEIKDSGIVLTEEASLLGQMIRSLPRMPHLRISPQSGID